MKVLNIGGNSYTLLNSVQIHDTLPLGVYNLTLTQEGPVLIGQEDLELPEKIYSNDKEFIDHVLTTWEHTDQNLGVQLVGDKGLGKSFTASVIAKRAGVPVIKITTNAGHPGILNYLDSLEQDYVLMIDEFDKLFKTNEELNTTAKSVSESQVDFKQDHFLSFLDRGFNSQNKKCLFIITGNDKKVNPYFVDRPSRIRYTRKYSGISEELAREIVLDLLENENYLEDIFDNITLSNINIDTLIQIIKEVNNHNKPYSTFKDFFNYTKSIEPCTYVIEVLSKKIEGEEQFTLVTREVEFSQFASEDNFSYDQRMMNSTVNKTQMYANNFHIERNELENDYVKFLKHITKQALVSGEISEETRNDIISNLMKDEAYYGYIQFINNSGESKNLKNMSIGSSILLENSAQIGVENYNDKVFISSKSKSNKYDVKITKKGESYFNADSFKKSKKEVTQLVV